MKKIGFVVSTIVFILFIAISPSFSSPTEELEGTLEIIMATEIGKKSCEPLYFVNVSGKRTQFSLPARVPPLSPGQKIKITGRWEEISGKKSFHCRKVESVAVAPVAKRAISSADSVSDYLPKQEPVLGPQNVLVVCLNSPDTENDSPVWSEEKISDKIFSNPHSLNAYWEECSGEKVWLTGDILNNGNWKTMPKNWTEYGYGSDNERDWSSEFITDLVELIDPEIDFSKSQYAGIIVFRAGKKWKWDWSTAGKRKIFTKEGEVRIAVSVLNEYDIEINNDYSTHETGHGLFSLSHAHSQSILSGERHAYGDWYENRGGYYALLDGLHKYILGWLDISQIQIITVNGNYWLDQRELASDGTKLLVIFLRYDGWYGNYYREKMLIYLREKMLIYLEYHRGLGEFDSQLSFSNKNEAVDPNNLVLLRKYAPGATGIGGDSLLYVASDDGNDLLDLESQEFCDSDYENLEHHGICVRVLQKTGTGANSQAEVKITLTSDYSFPTPIPTPTPTPTPTPSPTPTPTPTPTPCEPDIISISSGSNMNIKKKTSGKVTVEVKSANGCAVEGETVEAIVTSASGQKRISVSPPEGETDENGQVVFTITAQKKLGNAVVAFWAGNLKTFLYVKVSKK